MVLLTVFTPTYNRAHTLPEAYCSLKAQTSKAIPHRKVGAILPEVI